MRHVDTADSRGWYILPEKVVELTQNLEVCFQFR